MTTYNTGNPVGSVDVKDLYDNAQNLDHLVNDQTVLQYPDRFGNARKTYWGLEQDVYNFLINSQFELPPLTYVDGTPLTVERASQVIQRAGQLYRVLLPAAFPTTLSGTWAADEPLLTAMTDSSLRADLAASSGAGLVGWSRNILSAALTTVGQMLDSMPTRIWEYASVISDKPNPADPNTWDWTPAIQAAVNAAQNTTHAVFFGPGTFLCKTIQWRSNVAAYFGGACLKAHPAQLDASVMLDMLGELTNIQVFGPGTIDGDKTNFGTSHRQHGIRVNASNVTIKDITVKNIASSTIFSMGDGIILQPTIPSTGYQVRNVTIDNCIFDGIDRQCVTVESGIGVSVVNCKFVNSTYAAIDLENSGYTIGDVNGVVFSGNYVENCLYGLTAVTAQPVNALKNITSFGNVFKGVQDAYQLRGCSNVKIGLGDIAEVTNRGIYILSDGATTADNIEIDGFTVSGGAYGIYGQVTGGGSLTRVKVTNPKITGSTTSAITFGNTSGLVIKGGDILVNVAAGVTITNCANPSVEGLKISSAIGVTGTALLFNGSTTLPRFGGIDVINFSTGINVNVSSPTTVVSGKGGDNLFNSVTTQYASSVGNYWRGTYSGTFTMGAANQINVNTPFANAASAVDFMPTNQAGATLSSGAKRLWCDPAGVSNNVSIRVKTADGTAAVGTEAFTYRLTNP